MKTILAVLLVLFCTPVIAQMSNDADQFFIIEDFSKGAQTHTSPYANPTGVANDLLNVRFNKEASSLAKRDVQVSYTACAAGAVRGLHRYYQADEDKFTIENIDTTIYGVTASSTACIPIDSGKTSGKRWEWLTYKDMAIGTSGYDAPVKWDGVTLVVDDTLYARSSGYVMAELGAPFAKLNTGSNLDATSWYQYKVAFYNSSGIYYYSNARSNVIKTGSTYKGLYLTDIPLGQTGTTKRIIYRTEGYATAALAKAATAFYPVAEIADNYTQTYADNRTDAAIIAEASIPAWAVVSAGINVTPPYAKHMMVAKERLLMGNRPDGTLQGKSTIYASELYLPDIFDTNSADKTFIIRPDDNDEITMMNIFMGTVYIGKNNSISYIDTSDASIVNWVIGNPRSFVGVSAPYSVASTPYGLIYLNANGVYRFDGNGSELMSDAMTKDIRTIPSSAIVNAVGVYHNNEYNLAYTDSTTGSAVNNRVLVYDFARKSFTKDIKYVDSWARFVNGDDFNVLYAGSSLTDGKVNAQTASMSSLVAKYQSDFDLGTYADTGLNDISTEEFPYIQIAWTKTIDDASFGSTTINGYTPNTAIIDRGTTSGTWTSPIYDLDAGKYDKLFWNATLDSAGTVTFAIRSATTLGGVAGASWSSEFTDPSGSDVSALTANRYVQVRASLATSDITLSPVLENLDNYVFKLTYNKVGTPAETSILSLWKTGFNDLDSARSNYPKIIKECNLYYDGTAGIVNVKMENLKGDIMAEFNVDLSRTRDPANGYFGNGTEKVFRYNFPLVPNVANFLTGDKFRITITENGTTAWKIQRLALRYSVAPYVPYK